MNMEEHRIAAEFKQKASDLANERCSKFVRPITIKNPMRTCNEIKYCEGAGFYIVENSYEVERNPRGGLYVPEPFPN